MVELNFTFLRAKSYAHRSKEPHISLEKVLPELEVNERASEAYGENLLYPDTR